MSMNTITKTDKTHVDTSEILDNQCLAIHDIGILREAMDAAFRADEIGIFWELHQFQGCIIKSVAEDNREIHDRYLSRNKAALAAVKARHNHS